MTKFYISAARHEETYSGQFHAICEHRLNVSHFRSFRYLCWWNLFSLLQWCVLRRVDNTLKTVDLEEKVEFRVQFFRKNLLPVGVNEYDCAQTFLSPILTFPRSFCLKGFGCVNETFVSCWMFLQYRVTAQLRGKLCWWPWHGGFVMMLRWRNFVLTRIRCHGRLKTIIDAWVAFVTLP